MLSSIFDTCTPRDEILAGDLSLDVFAAKLRLVVEGTAPQVYQNPQTFFANTFPTDGLKTLIAEVFGRLAGAATGSPIIRLETSFARVEKSWGLLETWCISIKGCLNLISPQPINSTFPSLASVR